MTGPKPALAELPHWPRLLSVDQAAAYVGVSVSAFTSRVGELWPAPIRYGRRKLFDRLAIDRAVDELSQTAPQSPAEKIRQYRGRNDAGGQVETR